MTVAELKEHINAIDSEFDEVPVFVDRGDQAYPLHRDDFYSIEINNQLRIIIG